jgi:Cysteine-rich CPXCG
MLDSVHITCPFCGERFEALVDDSGGEADYVEDCPVCCRPISLHLRTGADGEFDGLEASRDD